MKRKIYQEFESANILGLELEHNGIKGGDAGHGGYVRIVLFDLSSTCMECNGETTDKIEIVFRGDCERETLLKALKTIVLELESSNVFYKECNLCGSNYRTNNADEKYCTFCKVITNG